MASLSPQKQVDQLYKYLENKKLKKTHQRDAIAKVFFSNPDKHFTIEELLAASRLEDSTISYATVYRTLTMLVEAGLAAQRQFGKGQSQFEVITAHHHDHLICNQCGLIVEFVNDDIEKLQSLVAKKHGFTIHDHKLEMYGLCKTCKKK